MEFPGQKRAPVLLCRQGRHRPFSLLKWHHTLGCEMGAAASQMLWSDRLKAVSAKSKAMNYIPPSPSQMEKHLWSWQSPWALTQAKPLALTQPKLPDQTRPLALFCKISALLVLFWLKSAELPGVVFRFSSQMREALMRWEDVPQPLGLDIKSLAWVGRGGTVPGYSQFPNRLSS